MADTDKDAKEKEDVSNPNVVTKYRKAGDIANAAIAHVMKECAVGKKIVDLCNAGDAFITAATSKIYNKGKVLKGVGFPTCISVDHVVGHFSPLSTDENVLKEGDLIKIDLGVHVDGYTAVGAHTFQLGGGVLTGRKADVMKCAYIASELAQRMLKVGGKNTEITEMITKVADDFKCKAVQGVLSHQMTRYVVDGEKVILNRTDPEQKVDDAEFEPLEVYAVDIVMSSGEGKPKEVDERTTVYKRAQDTTYKLKLKASKAILSAIDKDYPTYPFTIRSLDEKKVRFGIVECYNHELVNAYPVLHEKEGEFIAHFKFTVCLLPGGSTRITAQPIKVEEYKSEYKLTDEALVKLLATSTKKKKKNKKKKKKKADAAPAADAKAK